MTIAKNNLTFLTLVGLSIIGFIAIATAALKSFASSSDYLGRLCSHMYGGWQRLLLTLRDSPFNLVIIALGILLLFGLIRAFLVLAKQLYKTKQYTKEIYAANFKSPLAAFCYGLIRQSIFLNQALLKKLSALEIKAVVLHEEYHLKNFDNLKILTVRFLSKALFFLPFIKNLAEDYESEKEFAADSYAAKKLGASTVAAALYHLLEMSPLESTENLLLGNFAGTQNRIERLLDENPKKAGICLRSWLVSFLIAFLVGLALFQKPAALAQSQMLMPTEKPNSACNSYCQPVVTCSKSNTPYLHPKDCSIPKDNP